jgi:HlyD family secretion protein
MQKTSRSVAYRHGGVMKILVAAVLLVAVGIGGVVIYAIRSSGSSSAQVLVTNVSTSPFEHAVVEEGEVESADNVEITCTVKSEGRGGTEILEVVPEGAIVEKGQVVVQLDDSAMQLELIQQRVVCNNKEASWIQAKNAVEAAKIARIEYLEGTYKQEEQLYLSEIFIAEENLRRAELSVQSSERLAARGLLTPLQLDADRFAVNKARNELENGTTKLEVLRKYTKAKMLKQFDSDIASTEALEESEAASFELEDTKRKTIETQIASCRIVAPKSGQVVHANIFDSRGDNEFIVQPGTAVREGQVILRMPDRSKMQATTKIKEAQVSLIKPGLPCLIRVDGQEGPPMRGFVDQVNEYPEPTSRWGSNIKRYRTTVRIEDPPEDLLVGRTAEVRILVEQNPKAIQIPVQSVVRKGGRNWVLVQKEDKTWETREVEVGSSNEKTVLVKDGVAEGEKIALNAVGTESLYSFPEGILKGEESKVVENFGRRGSKRPGGRPAGRPPGNATAGQKSGDSEQPSVADAAANDQSPGDNSEAADGRAGEFKPPQNDRKNPESPTNETPTSAPSDSESISETRTQTSPTSTADSDFSE